MSYAPQCKRLLARLDQPLIWFALFVSLGMLGCVASPSEPQVACVVPDPTTTASPVSAGNVSIDSPTADAKAEPREIYPGITLDLGQRHVDIDAIVVGRDVEWLELLACRAGTREYESVVATEADASQLNIALTLLGLTPGQPARTEKNEAGQRLFFAPHGPTLELFFVLDDQPDAPIPANQWVIDQQTREIMPDNTWVFTGSTIIEFQGNRFFMAEKNGTVVSLLNFGDELVSRPTDQSEAGGTDFWTANTDAIPPIGTALKLRFQPAE